jgi:hypothetical protein
MIFWRRNSLQASEIVAGLTRAHRRDRGLDGSFAPTGRAPARIKRAGFECDSPNAAIDDRFANQSALIELRSCPANLNVQ